MNGTRWFGGRDPTLRGGGVPEGLPCRQEPTLSALQPKHARDEDDRATEDAHPWGREGVGLEGLTGNDVLHLGTAGQGRHGEGQHAVGDGPGPDGAESRRDLRAADQWVGNPRLIWDSLGSGQRRVTTLRRV